MKFSEQVAYEMGMFLKKISKKKYVTFTFKTTSKASEELRVLTFLKLNNFFKHCSYICGLDILSPVRYATQFDQEKKSRVFLNYSRHYEVKCGRRQSWLKKHENSS